MVENRVVKDYLTTGPDGKNYRVNHYNLDAILAIGYRVRSHRGTQFRIWATERLREYLVKGFTMDDPRLKAAGGGEYFEELLARIRDIRSSERVFWRKVLNIYATSIDYDPAVESSTLFFKTVQNKMHWAAHGHTAAEIVHERTGASKPNMGLTSWSAGKLRKADVQYEIYRQEQATLPQPVDEHFDRSLEELKQIEKRKKKDQDTDSS